MSHSIDNSCARNVDSSLKDASKIVWYNNADDEAPLPSVSASSPSPTEKGKGKAVHRSDRTVKPTQHVLDMKNNGGSSSTASSLRKKKHNTSGSPLKTSSHHTKKATVASESDNDEKTDTILRAIADADSQKSPHHSKEELTADICTLQKGHQCKICFQNKSKSFFFTGGILTLHTHIARWHSKEYLELCEKLGITPHPHAMPKNVSEGSLELTQSNLDLSITHESKPPVFTMAGLLDHIVELIVCENEAFRLIDRGSFRQLIRYCHPSIAENNIPH
ncbi:hypothetical protein BDQ17DRAFT_1436257 [Cyathus striatus]|nr:hypothetical protein BDQ17DRAFT_1436257 [Cyathus striatus]